MSPVPEYAERYKAQSRARENGAQDGMRNLPPGGKSKPAPAEAHVMLLAENDLAGAAAEWRERCTDLIARQRASFEKVPINLTSTLENFKAQCELQLLEYENDTVDAWLKKDARAREYRGFKAMNGLARDARPETPLLYAFALLFVAIIAESGFNAFFFKDASESALVAGVAMAFVISLINSGMGFLAGALPLRYMTHRRRLHILWAVPLALALVGAIVSFNLLIGHLRDAVARLVEPGTANIRTQDVLNPFLKSPFGLMTLESWALLLIGAAIACYSIYKAFNVFDPYPRFGKVYKLMQQAEDEYRAQLVEMKEPLDESAKSCQRNASDEYARISKDVTAAFDELDELDACQQDFLDKGSGITNACNAALMEYRAANVEVRGPGSAIPDHFRDSWQPLARLDDEITEQQHLHDHLRAEVDTRAKHLKAQYEDLIRGVPETIARLLSEDAIKTRVTRLTQQAAEQAERNWAAEQRARAEARSEGSRWSV